MKIIPTDLPGVVLFEPRVFGDARGFFLESWNAARYQEAGLPERFVQDNLSRSKRGILRGLHFQNPQPQGKLVSVLDGEVFDVALDIRRGSPNFGRWFGITLSEHNRRQLYVPPGFAHGFCVTSDTALFAYKCTDYYSPATECSLRWDDPELDIEWPVDVPELSEKDSKGFLLKDVPPERLPVYRGDSVPSTEESPVILPFPSRGHPDKRRILLTGATGQVGSALRGLLAPFGEVVATDQNAAPAAEWQRLDLTDTDAIQAAVRQIKPHLIVNAAAYTQVDKAEANRDEAMAVNAVAPGVLAREAARLNAALLHFSTDYVYDGSGSRPWREDDPTGPQNVYGESKLAGENAVRDVDSAHLILRTSWVYGLHGSNFVRTMLRLGEERTSLSIVADQIGAPTTAEVIAEAVIQILSQGADDLREFFVNQESVCHLVCRGYTSWHGFAERIFDLARQHGLPLSVRQVEAIRTCDYPTPAKRPLNSRLALDLLRTRYGVSTPTWDTALERWFAEAETAASRVIGKAQRAG